MTSTDPFVDVVPVRRIKDGQLVAADIAITWYAPSELTIDSEWNGSTWKKRRVYLVRDLPTDWAGRGFQVIRMKPKVTKYNVFIDANNPALDLCDCWGRQAHGHCVHTDALRHLVAKGRL